MFVSYRCMIWMLCVQTKKCTLRTDCELKTTKHFNLLLQALQLLARLSHWPVPQSAAD